ncbi:MAG: prephenate dehydrogenase/arogenate dehydrogenase family protein [Desulfobacteraceae bacterium]|nr:prephenate dehydrogenase/arogenate dehydrogenase family protein [Desulfobacteraceae bacterium]
MIGIVGYGRFGKLMARYLSEDFTVRVYRRREGDPEPWETRIAFDDLDGVCRLPLVILAVPISAMASVLAQVAPRLRDDALVADVCSVKTLPIQWMREALPASVSILATHPMFGPDSAADSLRDRKVVLCRERVPERLYRKIKSYLSGKGLRLIETTADEHDRQIAVSLALTHTIGRALSAFGAGELPIDTEGYRRLLHILGVVEHDTWQLFQDMNAYNPYAAQARSNFLRVLEEIHRKLP